MSHTGASPKVCGGDARLLHELPVLQEDLAADERAGRRRTPARRCSALAVARVAELLRQRGIGAVGAEGGVLRLVAEEAPVALDGAAVHVEHGDSLVAVAVGDGFFVGRRVEGDPGLAPKVIGGCCRWPPFPGMPICRSSLPSCVNLRMCESPLPLPPIQTLSLRVNGDAVVGLGPKVALPRLFPRHSPACPADRKLEHRRRRHAALAAFGRFRGEHLGAGVERLLAMHDEDLFARVDPHADAPSP